MWCAYRAVNGGSTVNRGATTLITMAESTENLVIEHLRAIRGDLAEFKADMIEIKTRIGHMEGLYANLSARVDRLAGDIQHIKRRLDLVEV
jgi:hypothetical protein